MTSFTNLFYFADLPRQPEPIKNLNELIKAQVSARHPSFPPCQLLDNRLLTATLLCFCR
jgi:hypothetical protein